MQRSLQCRVSALPLILLHHQSPAALYFRLTQLFCELSQGVPRCSP